LRPDFGIGYSNHVYSYVLTDRFADAERVLQRAAEPKLDMPDFLAWQYTLGVLKGDQEQMDRAVHWRKASAWQNAGSLTSRPSRWRAPAACKPHGGRRAAPLTWPSRREIRR
jgi:hypothetical protein